MVTIDRDMELGEMEFEETVLEKKLYVHSNLIKKRIADRKLWDYIQEKRCRDLMGIYEVDLPIFGLEPESVVAPDSETAVWYYLARKNPCEREEIFEKLYEDFNEQMVKGEFTKEIGRWG